jgi:hypothetical protein
MNVYPEPQSEQSRSDWNPAAAPPYPPLDRETRETLETAAAAHHLNRRPQTLRAWACLETGPIRPLRINGRLAWRVADLRRLLGVAK